MTDMDADKQEPTTDTAPMTANDQQLAAHLPSNESVENATVAAAAAAEEAGKYNRPIEYHFFFSFRFFLSGL